jgi:U3 small nucleolar RNA-associated protein 14
VAYCDRYEVRKKDIGKWTPLVKGNREAPTLVLTSGRGDVPAITTSAALASRVTPVTDMEREVADLLKASGAHNEASIIEAEQSLVVKVGCYALKRTWHAWRCLRGFEIGDRGKREREKDR